MVLDGVLGTDALDTAYRGLCQRTKATTVSLREPEATITRVDPRAGAVFQD